jgi:hypothetical protein
MVSRITERINSQQISHKLQKSGRSQPLSVRPADGVAFPVGDTGKAQHLSEPRNSRFRLF